MATKAKAKETEEEEEEEQAPPSKYQLNIKATLEGPISLPLLLADRRCYQCQQGEEIEEVLQKDPGDLIEQIKGHCATMADYLLPDTALKEAVFRLIISGGNKPMDASQISRELSERWAMSAYPRDVSPAVIQRLLDNSKAYGLAAVPSK